MAQERTLYAVLEVPADATQDAIKKAYRRLALQHHPDRQRGRPCDRAADLSETFARIAFAYEVLGHDQRRKRYDLTGEVPQTDAALGRRAAETFMAEYVRAAPKVAREVTQADMSLHSLDNYEVLEVDGRDVPAYMREIVMQGLSYLVAVVEGMEEKEVVLLRHFVMDQMYALLAYTAPLDEFAFSERGYIITYYDHPLQAGIRPSWSDQNGAEHRKEAARGGGMANLKDIEEATVERRKLVALEWHGGTQPDVQAIVGETVPGEGVTDERIQLGMVALLKLDPDLEARTVHHVRRELERLLAVEQGALDQLGATAVLGLLYAAREEIDEGRAPDDGDDAPASAVSAPAKAPTAVPSQARRPTTGCSVSVRSRGLHGVVLVDDPSDPDMTYKVRFEDGSPDDWFRQMDVILA